MIPLFIAAVVAWYAVDIIAGTGLATGFAVGYLDTLKSALAVFDTIVIFVFAAAFGGVIIRSFRLNTHPVLGILGLVFLPVAVFGAAYASNVFGIFTGLDFLGTALNQFTLSATFFQNSALITAGAGVLVLLVMVGGGLIRR